MPYKLVAPRAGRAHTTFRVRGTENGVYLDKSTGARDRKTAQRVLSEWKKSAWETGSAGRPQPMTFAAAAIGYMEAGGERRFLSALLQHFGTTPVQGIGQAEIDAAASALYPGASSATRNRQVYTPISAVMRHAGHQMILKRPKGAQGRPRTAFLTPDDARRLLEACRATDPRLEALCTFLLYTGCRLGEGLDLKWEDVDLDLTQAIIRRTKNGKPRWVHLTPALIARLRELPRNRSRVFRLRKNGELYRLWGAAVAQSLGVLDFRGVAFHILRHTWGTWMRRYAGLDTIGLMATGAWASRSAAEGYAHADTSAEARKADLLPVWE